MQLVVFILAYPVLWVISRLPFTLVYFFSDGLYILLYTILGYRKKVVRRNLALVFPQKGVQERLQLERKFYRHLCDIFLEMIKTIGISDKELQKRFVFTNPEVLHQLEAKNKSAILMLPHYANWEWGIALHKHITFKGYAVYQKISNRYFDRLIRNIRQKFGTTLIATTQTSAIVTQNKEKGVLSLYGILSDQSPMRQKALLWTSFMGIKVPAHTGAELLCRRLNLPAVYLKVTKVQRGYYRGTFRLITEKPRELQKFELTKTFLNMAEASIREAPEYYFWTHRRWKHKDKIPKAFQNTTARNAG